MSTVRTYVPSGRFSSHALVTVPLLGILLGALLATAYAYLTLYLPIVGVVTFLLTGGVGLLLGMGLSALLHRGKVRNRMLGLALGLFVALVTFYVQWAVWSYALLRRDDVDVSFLALLLQPWALWDVITVVNQHGAWSLKGATPTGGVLWALWAVEGLILVGLPTFLALASVDTPYCEACESWCGETKGVRVTDVPADGEATVLALAERDDVAALSALGVSHEGTPFLRWDLHACGCGETSTLCASKVTPTVDKQGKPGEETTLWLSHWLLQKSQASSVRVGMPRTAQDEVVLSHG
ncbi:MAG: hypothetical protein AMXMBFR34_50100 [Myxococcaceae bacterium]